MALSIQNGKKNQGRSAKATLGLSDPALTYAIDSDEDEEAPGTIDSCYEFIVSSIAS